MTIINALITTPGVIQPGTVNGSPIGDLLDAYYGNLTLGQRQTILLNFIQNTTYTIGPVTGSPTAAFLTQPYLPKPTPPNPLTDPNYATDIQTYTTTLLPAYNAQQELLLRFTSYLQTSVNANLPLPPPPGTTGVGDVLASYVGSLTLAQQQAIWAGFLAATGNSAYQAQYNAGTLQDTPALQQALLAYIQHLIASEQLLLPVNPGQVLTPDEIKKRAIMFSVFNACVSMLLSLQNTVSTQAQLLNFLGQWQQQYTNMLTKVPTYVGGESSTVVVNLNDLSKFTFGYDNISVADIANWWANNQVNGINSGPNANASANTFTIENFTILNNTVINSSGVTTNTVSLTFGPTGIFLDNNSHFTNSSGTFTTGGQFSSTPLPAGNSFAQNVTNFENAFKAYWPTLASQVSGSISTQAANVINSYATIDQNLTGNATFQAQEENLQLIFSQQHQVTDPLAALEIIKPYTYIAPATDTSSADPQNNLSSTNSKSRAEINSRDQQYIQNVTTLRQTVQNTSQQVQANLTNSQQELSNQTDLITAIVTSLEGILSSIFR